MNIKRYILLAFFLLLTNWAFAQTNPNVVRIRLGSSINFAVGNQAGLYSFQWYRDGRPIANATGATYTASVSGLYQVVSISTEGCRSDLSDGFLLIIEYADLEVRKISETRYVGPGEGFEYQISVQNNGNTTATGIEVIDRLPGNLKYLGFTGEPTGEVTVVDQLISWKIPALANNQKLVLSLKTAAIKAGKVINTANVTAVEPDPNLANNVSTDVKEIIEEVVVPNVITPNGDGKNDVFIIDGLELYPNHTLFIFNRWGNEVYNSKGAYKNDWNGNGLNEGTYYYLLKIKAKDGSERSTTGWITLIKD
ncbi:conserved repeat domain-containing protein/gliding motility-associated C-terminal domain-containing protein [Pedobacter terrae]|uniref:Conserved repeat domain-containing protein/gliding motility-associated C-terminal domain-containing protein n=1 Tax=Pedobacter terrae TaxID=405671 RepID=A0A1G7NVM6_9SPHI|nr:gliding motility-associated C-terminal domain-containing protein [Pedobacter terrae]SDF78031.1 conserved repeat domain-containing protein/gliding motility-associated C-terminal domain-containing protein [Pedobacter terrae]